MDRPSHLKRLSEEVPARVRPALAELFEGFQYAKQTSGNLWEFAVEITQLTALGLTPNDFRWLVRNNLVQHQRDVTVEGDRGRAFRPTGDLVFCGRSCFILTKRGILLAREVCQAERSAQATMLPVSAASVDFENRKAKVDPGRSVNGQVPTTGPDRPKWHPETRELRLDGKTVKHFRWRAVNQETILSVFEEEGWPSRIDDPLPPQAEQDCKRRLCDTVKCLNRKQRNKLIRFRGDGTGEGVIWSRVEGDVPCDALSHH